MNRHIDFRPQRIECRLLIALDEIQDLSTHYGFALTVFVRCFLCKNKVQLRLIAILLNLYLQAIQKAMEFLGSLCHAGDTIY